jgi:hypothetical protein
MALRLWSLTGALPWPSKIGETGRPDVDTFYYAKCFSLMRKLASGPVLCLKSLPYLS